MNKLVTAFILLTASSSAYSQEIFFDKVELLEPATSFYYSIGGNFQIVGTKNVQGVFPNLPGYAYPDGWCVGMGYHNVYINNQSVTDSGSGPVNGFDGGWYGSTSWYVKPGYSCSWIQRYEPDLFYQTAVQKMGKLGPVSTSRRVSSGASSYKACVKFGFGNGPNYQAPISIMDPQGRINYLGEGCSDVQKPVAVTCRATFPTIDHGVTQLSDIANGSIKTSVNGTISCPSEASVSLGIQYTGSIVDGYDILKSGNNTLKHKTTLSLAGKTGNTIPATTLNAGNHAIEVIDEIFAQTAQPGQYSGSVIVLMNSN